MNADPGVTQPFDPLQFPLHGWGLIEASAGTGKTWSIALLYLRLVLGHGSGNGATGSAFPRPLAPPEILVMTFTEAATQELRERIRQRLTQAARVFADEAPPPDDALAGLRAAYPPDQWPIRAAQLRLAAESMDDAAVHTLHGWAARVLREHALACGSAFDEKIASGDGTDVQWEALLDYWRRTFYALDTGAARAVKDCFDGPEDLWKAVRPLLRLPREVPLRYQGKALQTSPDGANVLQYLQQQGQQRTDANALQDEARRLWRKHRREVEAIWRAIRPHLHGNSYRHKDDDTVFNGWLAALANWSEGAAVPDDLKIERFTPSGAKLKKGQTLPEHPALSALETWLAAQACIKGGLGPLRARLVAQAARAVREQSARIRTQRAELGFDDLLTRLDAALTGPGGDALAARLRTQYPVALVDEFQDTDALQYHILQRIYSRTENDDANGHALILIGDPKQAIYAFRGADIRTYLAARADALAAPAAGTSASLATNYRSTGALVAAVNHLFTRAAQRDRGAFGFRQDGSDPVPFVPVQAHGRTEQLRIDGQAAPALTLWNLPPEPDKSCVGMLDYRARMAQVFAARVVHWLGHTRLDDPLHCGFVDAQQQWQPLQPKHIAVLVRTGAEAETIRIALQARGVPSVYLSERASVFETQQARDVALWLAALADPTDEARLRAAIATPTLDLPLSELKRLAHDDLAWEEAARRWHGLSERWLRQGVLPMLHALLHAHDLPARLLAQESGERKLTNVLHLAEWLQRRAGELDGPRALLRALQARIREPGSTTEGDQEHLLRLESDGEQLKIVTLHKSKGLEYPLVLLPFIAAWRDASKTTEPAVFHDETAQTRVVELDGAEGKARERVHAERMAEDMRLLYVALTRARHALWLGVAPLAARANAGAPQLESSALGQILGQNKPIDSLAAYQQALDDLCKGQQALITVAEAPAPDSEHWRPPAPPALQSARAWRHGAFAPWWIASYTALTRGMSTSAAEWPESAPGSFDDAAREWALGAEDEDTPAGVVPSGAATNSANDVCHAFPRGTDAGTVLHGLLQWCARQGFARALADPAGLRDQAARKLAVRGWTHWIDPVCNWLRRFLQTPLPLGDEEQPQRLADLGSAIGEMEFWLPVQQLDVARLDALITAHCWPGQARPALAPGLLAGMVKGYIDLVFAHASTRGVRYGIADYKSHWLGPDATAYQPHALRAAMLAHRYDVQATLYALALHRLLRARLPGYDIEQHLGSAAYCFLRGSTAQGCGVITLRPPRALIEALDTVLAQGTP